MPWHIEAANDGYFVVNTKTGEKMSNDPFITRKLAARQMRALYASESKKEHTSVMVALYVPVDVAKAIAIPGGELATDLHITLVYLGDVAGVDLGKLSAAAGEFSQEFGPLTGKIGGVGRFTETGGDDAIYLSFDSPDLPHFRECLIECLEDAGIEVRSEHGFTPHITLAYIPDTVSMPEISVTPWNITFDDVLICHGDTHIPFKLSAAAKEVSATPTAGLAHGGKGGLLSAPGLSVDKKEIDLTPPTAVRKAALQGLALRKQYGRGGLSQSEAGKQGIGSGVARAVSLSKGQAQSPDTIRRMVAFFDRHEKNKDTDPKEGNGKIAWLLWGGDAGRAWAVKMVSELEGKTLKHLSGEHAQATHSPRRGGNTQSLKDKIKRLDTEIKALQSEASKAKSESWPTLKGISDKIGVLMERRKSLLQEIDKRSQLTMALKHRQGQHNQKRHGWRFSGGIDSARRAMRAGVSDDVKGKIKPEDERDAYRKAAGMAPVARAENKPDEAQSSSAYGDSTTAFGTSPGKRYEFKYVLKDLDQLVTSNTIDGGVNPKYTTELQPRMRSRQASKDQVESIAKNLDPDEILTDFHILEKGPMIIGKDGMVESGNGRTIALKLAKEAYPEKWAEYQKALKSKLAESGIDPAEAAKVKNPVLVRERVSQVDRSEFAREANQPPVLGMSPLEMAHIDASRITPGMIQNLKVGDDQSIDKALRSPSNSDFVRQFVKTVPANERATILRADGSLNQMGLWRIKAAIFSRVFQGEAGQRLADTFLESLDSNIKNFENALSAALPKLAQAEGLMQAGRRNKGLSMADDITKAVDMLARLKESNTKVSDYLAQSSLFGAELNKRQRQLLNAFEGMSRKPTEIKNFLTRYADLIINSTATGQGTFSGMTSTLNNLDDLMGALMPSQVSIPEQVGMFG